jgi:hypothetical protein
MVFKNIVLLTLVLLLTSSCALWPYEKDFDCPIKKGLKCKSLYEIGQLADQGFFGPNAKKQEAKICHCKTRKVRTYQKIERCCVG